MKKDTKGKKTNPIVVIGAGSWGTALAIALARNQQPTRLWGSGDYVSNMVTTRCNMRYLPNIVFPDTLQVFPDLDQALEGAQDILIAVPSHAFRFVLEQVRPKLPNKVRILCGTKGLDPETNKLCSEVILEVFSPGISFAVLAGPSFALDVAKGLPTAVALASNDPIFAQDVIKRLHSHTFRIYIQDDLIGVQVCGAVKNVLAVATGIADGLKLGANARAALITRGLTEMIRLGTAMGGKFETFVGLAGLGDLVLTCTDDLSRNRRFGYAIGQGLSFEAAEHQIGQVVEGKSNAFKVLALAQEYKIEMPIIEQVVNVLQRKVTPQEAVEALLAREPKREIS